MGARGGELFVVNRLGNNGRDQFERDEPWLSQGKVEHPRMNVDPELTPSVRCGGISSRPSFTASSRLAPFIGLFMWFYASLSATGSDYRGVHFSYTCIVAIASLGLCRPEKLTRVTAIVVIVLCAYVLLGNFAEACKHNAVSTHWTLARET